MTFNLIYTIYGAAERQLAPQSAAIVASHRHLLVIQRAAFPPPACASSLNMLNKRVTHGSDLTLVSHQPAPVCCYSPTAVVAAPVRQNIVCQPRSRNVNNTGKTEIICEWKKSNYS